MAVGAGSDALSIPGTHMEEIQVEEEVKERLDLDEEKKLAELTKTAITSVQHKLKGSLPMSDASIASRARRVSGIAGEAASPGRSGPPVAWSHRPS
ncbi:hypothetical protein ACIBQ5_37730 [Streptomyces massasporeus]|uniref:hypothetical protein n=1 Tax=Streptomyces massasporeus TaxID=67324 RepID=UPI00379E2ACA